MKNQKRIRDYGIIIGEMTPGKLNSITDVPGVMVGHCTVDAGEIQSGVTAITPAEGNLFTSKVLAASSVFNGFGKSLGLLQVDELGTLETPILLTNTLCAGGVAQAVVRMLVEDSRKNHETITSINPVVLECNDSYLNDIGQCAIGAEHVRAAMDNLSQEFTEGAVGAGRGMSCYRLKGGIGTASRQLVIDETTYHLGSLVLTNMGLTKELIVGDKHIGKIIAKQLEPDTQPDRGSVVVIIGCDIPLSERQLKRVANRAITGISRTGSSLAHGSGELSLAFTTQNRVMKKKSENCSFSHHKMLFEPDIDLVFKATIESVEEAILNSMITAEKVIGVQGNSRAILQDFTQLF